jgi:hypothetical protein
VPAGAGRQLTFPSAPRESWVLTALESVNRVVATKAFGYLQNLQSRGRYHFATEEALLRPRP